MVRAPVCVCVFGGRGCTRGICAAIVYLCQRYYRQAHAVRSHVKIYKKNNNIIIVIVVIRHYYVRYRRKRDNYYRSIGDSDVALCRLGRIEGRRYRLLIIITYYKTRNKRKRADYHKLYAFIRYINAI